LITKNVTAGALLNHLQRGKFSNKQQLMTGAGDSEDAALVVSEMLMKRRITR
jgi:hypothetical protein